MFSKASEYGIRAMVYIGIRSLKGERANLLEIASATGSPASFTSKVLQKLVRSGLLSSVKGSSGGFFLDKEELSEVRLSDIVTTLEGDEIFTACGLGLGKCRSDQPCYLHSRYAPIREDLRKMLEETTLSILLASDENMEYFLKR